MTDNTELIIMRDAMDLLLNRLAKVIWNLSSFAIKWKGEHSGFSFSPLALSICMQYGPETGGVDRGLPPLGRIQASSGLHSTGESDHLWCVSSLVVA